MPAPNPAGRSLAPETSSFPTNSLHYLLLYTLTFAVLLLLHAPLLRLPYFWDEAGYYIPAAHDLYAEGTLIPHSTVSNAHPPLVMAWLALAWRVFGFSPTVTRMAMLALAAFALVGLFRLARSAANLQVAWATVVMVAVYPVFFCQSSLAQLDVAAAGFTFWGLQAYVEERRIGQVVCFSLAALTKETAILAPVALCAWEAVIYVGRAFLPADREFRGFGCRGQEYPSHTHLALLLAPLLPLAGWYGFHYAKTGYLLGNPEFVRYNVAATLDVVRIPIALALRLWQMFGYFGLWLLTVAGVLAMTRKPLRAGAAAREIKDHRGNGIERPRGLKPESLAAGSGTAKAVSFPEPTLQVELLRPRIPVWIQGAFLSVAAAYLLFMSVIGGAALARYMLPVVPLIIMVLISTLWRRVHYWWLIVAAITVVFVTGLFHNPPHSFSLEDNLAYRDFIVLHCDAIHFLQERLPGARVLTAWPASDELNRPWLGYVPQPMAVVRIEDFTPAEVERAIAVRDRFDVALVFSTKYEPAHPLFENWQWWRQIKERYFGYHRDFGPEEIARRLNGKLLLRREIKGQWVGVIELEQRAPN